MGRFRGRTWPGVVAALLLIAGLGYAVVLLVRIPLLAAPEFETAIEFPSVGESVYIKRVESGGLAGADREEIYVTSHPKEGLRYLYDSTSEYYYDRYNEHGMPYRKFKDTLELFVTKMSNVPPHFDSPIKIRQVYISQWVQDSVLAFPKRWRVQYIK
jgi:hypothetical protein